MSTLPPLASSEIKGVWFTTARRFVLDRPYGADALDAMANRVDRVYRDILLEPLASEWYPERALQQAMGALHHVIAEGSDDRFTDAMEACTVLGISRFFRALMRLGSPATILRKTPAMWNHIRRGAGHVAVEADSRSAIIRYTRFPYFRDPNYRLLTVGAVRALVRICGCEAPHIDTLHHDWDTMVVRVSYT